MIWVSVVILLLKKQKAEDSAFKAVWDSCWLEIVCSFNLPVKNEGEIDFQTCKDRARFQEEKLTEGTSSVYAWTRPWKRRDGKKQ